MDQNTCMNRILQVILALIFIQHMVALLVMLTFIPARIMNLSKDASKPFSYPAGQQKFESSVSLGPLRLSQTMEYDSARNKGIRTFYAGLPHLTAFMTTNGQPTVKNASGEAVMARFSKKGDWLEVPISADRYRHILTFAFVMILLYLILLLYMMAELYAFSKQAGRQEFFNYANRRRLRIFGAFILITVVVSYVVNTSGAWILQELTGTSGYQYLRESKEMGSFPIELVAGLLMFIIANAFGKGQYLQTEQDLTI